MKKGENEKEREKKKPVAFEKRNWKIMDRLSKSHLFVALFHTYHTNFFCFSRHYKTNVVIRFISLRSSYLLFGSGSLQSIYICNCGCFFSSSIHSYTINIYLFLFETHNKQTKILLNRLWRNECQKNISITLYEMNYE